MYVLGLISGLVVGFLMAVGAFLFWLTWPIDAKRRGNARPR